MREFQTIALKIRKYPSKDDFIDLGDKTRVANKYNKYFQINTGMNQNIYFNKNIKGGQEVDFSMDKIDVDVSSFEFDFDKETSTREVKYGKVITKYEQKRWKEKSITFKITSYDHYKIQEVQRNIIAAFDDAKNSVEMLSGNIISAPQLVFYWDRSRGSEYFSDTPYFIKSFTQYIMPQEMSVNFFKDGDIYHLEIEVSYLVPNDIYLLDQSTYVDGANNPDSQFYKKNNIINQKDEYIDNYLGVSSIIPSASFDHTNGITNTIQIHDYFKKIDQSTTAYWKVSFRGLGAFYHKRPVQTNNKDIFFKWSDFITPQNTPTDHYLFWFSLTDNNGKEWSKITFKDNFTINSLEAPFSVLSIASDRSGDFEQHRFVCGISPINNQFYLYLVLDYYSTNIYDLSYLIDWDKSFVNEIDITDIDKISLSFHFTENGTKTGVVSNKDDGITVNKNIEKIVYDYNPTFSIEPIVFPY